MKDVLEKIGSAYLDVSLKLTGEQADEIVRQELLSQLQSRGGIPEKIQNAMIEVLVWYTPNATADDWRHNIQ